MNKFKWFAFDTQLCRERESDSSTLSNSFLNRNCKEITSHVHHVCVSFDAKMHHPFNLYYIHHVELFFYRLRRRRHLMENSKQVV